MDEEYEWIGRLTRWYRATVQVHVVAVSIVKTAHQTREIIYIQAELLLRETAEATGASKGGTVSRETSERTGEKKIKSK